jgi:hypothetical protein
VTELRAAQVDHGGSEIGEAHPTAARFVATQRDAHAILEAREDVLDALTFGVDGLVPRGWMSMPFLGGVWMVQPCAAKSARNFAET